MTPEPTPAEAPEDDVLDGFDLDPTWSPNAVEAFREVLTVRPDIAGPELVALDQAATLITTAEALEQIAREASYVATGVKGQTVVHPAVPEARQSRVAAAQIMARLTVVVAGPRMTNSERGRAAAAARWSAKSERSRKGR